jgi:hypothetical protein
MTIYTPVFFMKQNEQALLLVIIYFFKGEYIKVMEQWHYKHTPALFKEHPKRKAKYNKLQPILQGASHCQSSGPPSLRISNFHIMTPRQTLDMTQETSYSPSSKTNHKR